MTLFGYTLNRRQFSKDCRSHRRGHNIKDSLTLADIRPGTQAKIAGFDSSISTDRHAHLQSYGIIPGYWVHVIQHSPVTIVRVEHIELALETELARLVKVSQ